MSNYYDRQYKPSVWRQRGDQPLLHRTRIRELHKEGVQTGTLVEIGAGEGHFAARAASSGLRVIATEFREEGIELARRNCSSLSAPVTFVRADATMLPLVTSSADALVAWDVLEHLADPHAALAEAHRVLKPGGVFAFSTPNPNALSVRLKGRESHVFRDPTHISVKPLDEWVRMVHEAGFAVVRKGFDSWWDAPYLGMPKAKVAWSVLAQGMWAIRTTWPWGSAENVVVWARREL